MFCGAGPRGRERAQLEAEAGRIRQANPAVAEGTERSAFWDQRGETAWASDKTAAQELRTKAGHARSEGADAHDDLPHLTDTHQDLHNRLKHLRNESRLRPDEPAVPADQGARQFERSRPKRSLNSTDARPATALDPVLPTALEPERRRPPQR